VTAQVFGETVDDDVHPHLDRTLEYRGGKGAVGHDLRARRVTEFNRPHDINDLQRGIGGGFQVEQIGPGAERFLQRGTVTLF